MAPRSKYLELLGLAEGATHAEIVMAGRRASMLHHPDRGGDPAKFKATRDAVKTLLKDKTCLFCGNKGWLAIRQGAFVRQEPCPRCWRHHIDSYPR